MFRVSLKAVCTYCHPSKFIPFDGDLKPGEYVHIHCSCLKKLAHVSVFPSLTSKEKYREGLNRALELIERHIYIAEFEHFDTEYLRACYSMKAKIETDIQKIDWPESKVFRTPREEKE